MTFLIDTHVALWYLKGSEALSLAAKDTIDNSDNSIVIHPASLWEAAIKKSIGKLDVDMAELLDLLNEVEISIMPHLPDPVIELSSLPFPIIGKTVHKDPFDRMIAATVLAYPEYRLVSCDTVFDLYGIPRIW